MSAPRRVFMIQPNGDLFQFFQTLVEKVSPGVEMIAMSDGAHAEEAFAGFSEAHLLITEVYLADGDGLAILNAFRKKFPYCPVIVATSYDLTDYAPYLPGLPVVAPPVDEAAVKHLVVQALQTVEGEVWPPYRVGVRVGADKWGDLYEATDQGVKREVYLTVLKVNASPQESNEFRQAAAYMARAGHPNVTAVYAAGERNGYSFFAREHWHAPTLRERIMAREKIDPRLGARVVNVATTVLLFWEANKYAHPVVTDADVTVAPNGVIKLINLVDPLLPAGDPDAQNLSALADALDLLLPPPEQRPPRLQKLLDDMRQLPPNVSAVCAEAQAIDIDLAPKREVAVSKEHTIAQKVIASEKKKEKRGIYLMISGLTLLLLALGWILYSKFSESNFTDFKTMSRVPSGEFIFQNGEKRTLPEFFIDQHEVTIGQYGKFLRWVDRHGSKDVAHPMQTNAKKDYTPPDWVNIINSIKAGKPYHGQLLTLDSPIFNVDWYDAQAYAKWKNKRLPTAEEWEKAARGTDGKKYPWGNEFRKQAANLGLDFEPDPHNYDQGGKIDGFNGPAPVDKTPGDVSTYGVFDMAGNVSEWTDTTVPNSKYHDYKAAIIKGGSYGTKDPEKAATTNEIRSLNLDDRSAFVGFRCATFEPPKDN